MENKLYIAGIDPYLSDLPDISGLAFQVILKKEDFLNADTLVRWYSTNVYVPARVAKNWKLINRLWNRKARKNKCSKL